MNDLPQPKPTLRYLFAKEVNCLHCGRRVVGDEFCTDNCHYEYHQRGDHEPEPPAAA